MIFKDGLGVTSDHKKSAEFFALACDNPTSTNKEKEKSLISLADLFFMKNDLMQSEIFTMVLLEQINNPNEEVQIKKNKITEKLTNVESKFINLLKEKISSGEKIQNIINMFHNDGINKSNHNL